jgi:hypothetical protein
MRLLPAFTAAFLLLAAPAFMPASGNTPDAPSNAQAEPGLDVSVVFTSDVGGYIEPCG